MTNVIIDTSGSEPGEFDYATETEEGLKWLALRGDRQALELLLDRKKKETTTEAQDTEVLYSPHQPRGKNGRWTRGIGAEPNIPAVTSEPVVGDVEAKLLNGLDAEIDPAHLNDLLRDMTHHASANLEHLQVTGSGNDGLFRKHAREIPRKEMPQLPESVEGAQRFMDALHGAKTELVEVDPRTLTLTQNELDSKKVGKLYGYIKDGGWQKDSLLYISRDNDIVDGHHRFAGACAAAATGAEVRVKCLKVDMPIDQLLNIANSVSGERRGMGQGFASQGQHFQKDDEDRPPPPSMNEPWVWVEGQWYKIVTDTQDDVPDNLDYIHKGEEPTTASAINPDEITRRVFVSRWH